MKKTHLLWKILVVVMIISAMMAMFVACDNTEKTPDDTDHKHVDADPVDGKCDICGTAVEHEHVDADKDYKCDICGQTVEHTCVDADPVDGKCDICGTAVPHTCVDADPVDGYCDICGKYYHPDHIDKNQDFKCDVCSAILPHDHVDNNSDYKCDFCGEITDHDCVDESPKDGKCDICGLPIEHTCVDESPKDGYCDICGKTVAHTCVDANNDYKCDICGQTMAHTHTYTELPNKCDICGEITDHDCVDADKDYECDLCGEPVDHVCADTDGDLLCDVCRKPIDTSENWTDLFEHLDGVIADIAKLGDLKTLGGEFGIGIDFTQGDVNVPIDINLDFGLDLQNATDLSLGTANAFGFTVDVSGKTYFGLWYVDKGVEEQNYLIAQFGALEDDGHQVIKFKAPSLAEAFDSFGPISVNENIGELFAAAVGGSTDSVLGDLAGGFVGTIAQLLALDKDVEGDVTTYTLPLTGFLFNTVGMADESYSLTETLVNSALGSIIYENADIYAAIQEIGLDLGIVNQGGNITSNATGALNDILPEIDVTLSFADGSVSIGLNIDGEPMSIPVNGGVLGELAGEGATELVLVGEAFEDITLGLSLDYNFVDNANGDMYDTVSEAVPTFEDANVREIDLLNLAIDTDITIGGINNAPVTTYNLKAAVSIDPSVIVEGNLLTKAYVVGGDGKGVYVDANGNGQYDAGEERTVPAVKLGSGITGATAYDAILAMIDNLYISLTTLDENGAATGTPLEVAFLRKTVAADGQVTEFRVTLKNVSSIQTILTGLGVDLSSMSDLFAALGDTGADGASIDKNSLVGGMVVSMLNGLVKGVSFDKPSEWTVQAADADAQTDVAQADGGFDFGGLIDQIMGYIDIFKPDVDTAAGSANITVDNQVINGATISFNATGSLLKDEAGNVNGVQLELTEEGLVIVGSDKVTTTVTLDKPLKVGGEDNLFSAQVTTTQTGAEKPLNMTIGIDLNAIGYGIVGEEPITAENFASMFEDTAFSVSK